MFGKREGSTKNVWARGVECSEDRGTVPSKLINKRFITQLTRNEIDKSEKDKKEQDSDQGSGCFGRKRIPERCKAIKYLFCLFTGAWSFETNSLEVNPSVVIGSFLVGILPYGPFPWRRS